MQNAAHRAYPHRKAACMLGGPRSLESAALSRPVGSHHLCIFRTPRSNSWLVPGLPPVRGPGATCRIRVPMVMAPWGVFVDLVSDRHLITMDVDDIDTCTAAHARSALASFAAKPVQPDEPSSLRQEQRKHSIVGQNSYHMVVAHTETAAVCSMQAPFRPQDGVNVWSRKTLSCCSIKTERGRTHQRADKDTFVHRSADEMCDEPRNNNEKEDFHHAPYARHHDDPYARTTFL